MGDHKTNISQECITYGPWGGSKGRNWIYKPNGFIRKITIVHSSSSYIYGIKFYSGGSSTGETESSLFGDYTKDRYRTYEICIDYPNEYLTSLSGTVERGGGSLGSLCFGTNQNQYGPFGSNHGTPFSYKGVEGVMIAGFHGRSGDYYLEAIGIYVMPISFALGLNSTSADNSMHQLCSRMTIPREPGPWGASGGNPWDDGVFSTVKQVRVHVVESLNVIYAIQFEYVQRDAKSVLSPIHGGTNGDKTELVDLDGTDEYLIGISGFYGPVKGYNGLEAITSITFHTNKRQHGPYGEESGVGRRSHTGFDPQYPPDYEVQISPKGFSLTITHPGSSSQAPQPGSSSKASQPDYQPFPNPFVNPQFPPPDWGTPYQPQYVPNFGALQDHGPEHEEEIFPSDEGELSPTTQMEDDIKFYTAPHGHLRAMTFLYGLQGDHKTNSEECTTHGPWGGSKGKSWIYKPNGFIRKISIVHKGLIHGIKFYSGTSSTGDAESSFFGSKDGVTEICIDCPNEYLTSISGRFVTWEGSNYVTLLCFGTNQNHYGPYGNFEGTILFSYEGEGVMIDGFHGRTTNRFIEAIGIYVMPKSAAIGLNSTSADNSMHQVTSESFFFCCWYFLSAFTLRLWNPWGASGGNPWDDGVFSTVKQVNLDVTDEYLTGISGFYGPIEGYNGLEAITSITFHTNKMIHGPYGRESGVGQTITDITYLMSVANWTRKPTAIFSFPGDHKTNCEGCVTHGPWGGSTGKNWIYKPNGFIRKITIVHSSSYVDGIKFYSGGSSTGETESSFFGHKDDSYQTDEICIDYPNEYLTSISGTISGTLWSLCFSTNQNQYGPYGDARGTPFSYEGDEGVMIVGFHGNSSANYLEAIGIYVMPRSFALGLNSTSADNSMHQLCSRMKMPRYPGPWGASGGNPWDDGVFSTVKQVRIHVGESSNVIHAIQFEYIQRDAKYVLSPIHGGTSGDKTELVNLDCMDEYLTGISGYYGPVEGFNGVEAITSITFYTNKTIYGPYGRERGAGYTFFNSTASSGKVVGFHGRKWNDGFLTAIGVHMEYF
ncbi:hypothetical protein OSB04_un000460 [Centaurea solstitialis]|uniref:Jacalin-type lectin domain-containing protein n=1 Tax=Centaurea solstitialis TaxID=347529 RepID=A0AA38S5X0_9ASTR|nr:hypothetical protein OSB04_un000460 [Centaurea solstitialis]